MVEAITYFIIFTDDYSCYCKTYFLKKKSKALKKLKEFTAYMETESGKKVKILRADRGGGFLSAEFKCYLKKFEIRSELTAANKI